jgi:hypothetical protein
MQNDRVFVLTTHYAFVPDPDGTPLHPDHLRVVLWLLCPEHSHAKTLSELVGVSDRVARRWLSGSVPVPEFVRRALLVEVEGRIRNLKAALPVLNLPMARATT